MKREYLPMLIFVVFNFIWVTVCLFIFWLPEYDLISKSRAALILQERLFAIKEENLTEYDNNLHVLEDLNKELEQGDVVLVPYSDVVGILAGIATQAAKLKLTETSFYMGEPSVFDVVSVLEASAEYSGAYDDLCALVKFIMENPFCVTDEISIHKQEGESTMVITFTLYALVE